MFFFVTLKNIYTYYQKYILWNFYYINLFKDIFFLLQSMEFVLLQTVIFFSFYFVLYVSWSLYNANMMYCLYKTYNKLQLQINICNKYGSHSFFVYSNISLFNVFSRRVIYQLKKYYWIYAKKFLRFLSKVTRGVPFILLVFLYFFIFMYSLFYVPF